MAGCGSCARPPRRWSSRSIGWPACPRPGCTPSASRLPIAKLNRMAAVAEQNERLRRLLETQHSLKLNVQLARVIGVDLGAYRYELTLNMGSRDGVEPGQPVIDAHGVMGP